MAQRMTLEEKLAEIAHFERMPFSGEVARKLKERLSDPSNIVVARSAEATGKSGQEDFIPALINTFVYFIRQPAAADKNCYAKEAIITALERLDNTEPEPYLRGIRHVQMEPVFGGRADTAANLRGHCAIALARMRRYPEAHFALAPLLLDAEEQPRREAIKALAHLGGEKSELLLRLKALTGDSDPSILGECFSALLAMEPDRSLSFVADFLYHAAAGDSRHPSSDRTAVEQAALALGNSRLDDAFTLLRECWEDNTDLSLRKALLFAIALHRSDEAFDYLLAIMKDEGRTTAILAVEALAIFNSDSRRRTRVEEAVVALRDTKITEAFREFSR